MTDTIIMSLPDACHDKDCPHAFHIRHIWMYDDGTFSECDSDGNHDDIDADDVPSLEEYEAAWAEYARHVIATGDDCLGEYMVERTVTQKQRWQFKFSRSILGVVLVFNVANSVFNTALYHYAASRQVPQGFSPEVLQGAFRHA